MINKELSTHNNRINQMHINSYNIRDNNCMHNKSAKGIYGKNAFIK